MFVVAATDADSGSNAVITYSLPAPVSSEGINNAITKILDRSGGHVSGI